MDFVSPPSVAFYEVQDCWKRGPRQGPGLTELCPSVGACDWGPGTDSTRSVQGSLWVDVTLAQVLCPGAVDSVVSGM